MFDLSDLEYHWQPLDLTQLDLTEALLESYQVLQLLAATAQSYVEPRKEGSHRLLAWAELSGMWMTQELDRSQGLSLAYQPKASQLLLVNRQYQPIASMPLSGATRLTIFSWLCHHLKSAKLDIDRLQFSLPYEPDEHPTDDGAAYRAFDPPELLAIEQMQSNTHWLLQWVQDQLSQEAPMLTNANHFNSSALYALGAGKAIRAGLMLKERPCFFFRIFGAPKPTYTLPDLDGSGQWHREGWTGIILPLDQLQTEAQHEQAQRFALSALQAARQILELTERNA